MGVGFGVWGLGFEVWGLGLRVWGMGFLGALSACPSRQPGLAGWGRVRVGAREVELRRAERPRGEGSPR